MSLNVEGPSTILPDLEDYPACLTFKPIDIGPVELLETRRWLSPSHTGAAEQISKKLHVAYFRPVSDAVEKLEQLSFSDAGALDSFLENTVLDDTTGPLLLIGEELPGSTNSEDKQVEKSDEATTSDTSNIAQEQFRPQERAITVSILQKLWKRFCIHPMIMDGYKSIPGFRHQLVQTEFGDGKKSARSILTYDFAYVCPMSWLSDNRFQSVFQNTHHKVFAYSKMNETGKELLAMYMNVRSTWVDQIIQSWAREHVDGGVMRNRPLFLAHLTLLESGLEELNENMVVFENASITWGQFRMEDRVQNPALGVEQDVLKHRHVIDKLDRILLNLETFETILQGLQSLIYKSWRPSKQEGMIQRTELNSQAEAWMMNTFNKLKIIRGRLTYLSKRDTTFEALTLQFASFQRHNSVEAAVTHIKQLADLNQEATRDLSELTRESRHDAVLMKFLAMITVVFLPITAVSTFFSMTFFSIDTSSTAVLPFSSLKFIWIFLLATAFVSAAMALAWWNRTKKTRTEKQREIDTKRQKDEASERATKLLIEATQHDRQKREERLEQATLRYEEKAAVEQSLMKNDEATAEDLKRAHAEATRAISELMAVQMACA